MSVTAQPATLPLDEIVVTQRYRKDMGDLFALAASIKEVGLLHPVVVDSRGTLVAGQRRLAALRSLGWVDVPVTIAESIDGAVKALMAERDENTCRKDMVFSEMLPLKHAIEELERPKAAERAIQAPGQPRGVKVSGSNLEHQTPPERKTRNIVAKALGKSATTLDKVEEVYEIAAAPETPEPVRKVAEQAVKLMDETGKVDGLHQQVKQAQSTHAIAQVLGDDVDYRRAQLLGRYFATLKRIGADLLTYNTESLSRALDDMGWDATTRIRSELDQFFDAIEAQRPPSGLRAVPGGKR